MTLVDVSHTYILLLWIESQQKQTTCAIKPYDFQPQVTAWTTMSVVNIPKPCFLCQRELRSTLGFPHKILKKQQI